MSRFADIAEVPVSEVALEEIVYGDLGTSLFTTRPVWEDLSARLPATIELSPIALELLRPA